MMFVVFKQEALELPFILSVITVYEYLNIQMFQHRITVSLDTLSTILNIL